MSLHRFLEKKRHSIGLSKNILQVIAAITMLIDHIGLTLIINGKLYGYDYTLYQNAINLDSAKNWLFISSICRHIGRISFPIFAFLIVEGFRKTSNIVKYILRMLFFALLSEIPFDLMVSNRLINLDAQNVLWTYAIGLIMLVVIKVLSMDIDVLHIVILMITLAITFFLKTDYWCEGILLIFIFYRFKSDFLLMLVFSAIVLFVGSIEKYHCAAMLSLIPIFFYDGTRGYINFKHFFYIFYPLHMIILYGIVFFSYLRI